MPDVPYDEDIWPDDEDQPAWEIPMPRRHSRHRPYPRRNDGRQDDLADDLKADRERKDTR